MNPSYAVPALIAHVAAPIAARHNLPVRGESPWCFGVTTSNRRAQREALVDVHPADGAAGRPELQNLPSWHGNCLLLLDADGGDRIAIHGSHRHRNARQQ
jgi:hypothetical protein